METLRNRRCFREENRLVCRRICGTQFIVLSLLLKEQESSFYTELARISEENKTLLNRLAEKEAEEQEKTTVQEPSPDSMEAGVLPHNTVLPTVSYVEEIYDMATGALESMSKVAPGFLIGMTREELTSYLGNYM